MVNRQALKYKVWYFPDKDKPTTGKQKNFNCGSKAVLFALDYPSTVQIGHHYITTRSISGLWCEYHQKNEYF